MSSKKAAKKIVVKSEVTTMEPKQRNAGGRDNLNDISDVENDDKAGSANAVKIDVKSEVKSEVKLK
jgi:hypothetical protein